MDLNHPSQAIYPTTASQLNAVFDPTKQQLLLQLVLKHQRQQLGHHHLGPPSQIYMQEEHVQVNRKASPVSVKDVLELKKKE
jgi:hypothetical protein